MKTTSSDISNQIGNELAKKLEHFEPKVSARRVGRILSVADGVAKVSGLPDVKYLELVSFPYGVAGVVINLEETAVGVIVLGDYLKLKEGDEVTKTGELLSIPVGVECLGRVLNPLGDPIDGKIALKSKRGTRWKNCSERGISATVNTPLKQGSRQLTL